MIRASNFSVKALLLPAIFVQQEEGPGLQPLFEPEPVPFRFDAPGWYVLIGVMVAALILVAYRYYRFYQRKAYRREALKTLDRLSETIIETGPEAAFLAVKVVLKQVAIRTFGRPKTAALHGKEWLAFLEATGKDTHFSSYGDIWKEGSLIGNPRNTDQLQKLMETSKKWIRSHA